MQCLRNLIKKAGFNSYLAGKGLMIYKRHPNVVVAITFLIIEKGISSVKKWVGF